MYSAIVGILLGIWLGIVAPFPSIKGFSGAILIILYVLLNMYGV